MSEGKSLDEYIGKLTRLSTEAFKDHRIVKAEERRWLIQGNEGCHFWVEVVALRGPMLLVHGDIDAVIFAYAGRHYKPRQMVSWIGGSSLDYAKEKATIGTGPEIATDTDSDLAVWELRQVMKDATEYDDQSVLRYKEEVESAIERLDHGEHIDLVIHDLYSEGFDPELISTLGRAVSSRVVYAHAAVKKLEELLEQQEKEKEHGNDEEADPGRGGADRGEAQGTEESRA